MDNEVKDKEGGSARNDDLKQVISKNIRAHRLANNWTQDDLAANVDRAVTRAAISQFETGRTTPSVDTLLVLAKAFRVEVSKLLSSPSADCKIIVGDTQENGEVKVFERPDFQSLIGKNIRAHRLANNWTQDDLAANVDRAVTSGAISQFETGRTTPSLDSLQMLARAFGVELSSLLIDTENDPDHHITPVPPIEGKAEAIDSKIDMRNRLADAILGCEDESTLRPIAKLLDVVWPEKPRSK